MSELSVSTQHYDLAVIGTGSGNTMMDRRFHHLKIALMEEGVFGGTCLNFGCIPTKMFVYSSDVAQMVRGADRYGVDAQVNDVRWPEIRDRVFGRIDPLTAAGERHRYEKNPNIDVFRGHAVFTGEHRIDTGTGVEIEADQIVIAAGSRPVIPEPIVKSGISFHTNETIMRLPELPKHLLILGGGTIAAEFAHVFSALGSKVSIITRSPKLLRTLDDDLSNTFTDIARERWNFLPDTIIESAEQSMGETTLHFVGGGSITGDVLLVATGRTANGDRLQAGLGGVEVDDAGRVVVDKYQRTTAKGVWALGDVSSPYKLKHVANAEARVVAANVLTNAWEDPAQLTKSDHRVVPGAIFSDPQMATVGLTERQARLDYDVTVGIRPYKDVAYGWAMEDEHGFAKIIADRQSGRILGAQILGAQASTLIQPIVQAMQFDLDARDMARGQYWIHPALTEVIENALLALDFA